MYRPQKHERVEVAWQDAMYDSDFDGEADHYEAALASLINIGFFVKMRRDVLVLASCFEPSSKTLRQFVTIPRKLVKDIRPVATVEPATPAPEEAK